MTFDELNQQLSHMVQLCEAESWEELLVAAKAHDEAVRIWFEQQALKGLTEEQRVTLQQHQAKYQAMMGKCAHQHEDLRTTLLKWQQSKRAEAFYKIL